jgi:hypothetical protein
VPDRCVLPITSANGNWGSTINFSIAPAGVSKPLRWRPTCLTSTRPSSWIGWSQGGAGYHGTPLIEHQSERLVGSKPERRRRDPARLHRPTGLTTRPCNLGVPATLVVGNWIGLNNTGTASLGKRRRGVQMIASDSTPRSAGLNSYERNVISAQQRRRYRSHG